MEHSPGFLKLVDESRRRVREITPEEAGERMRQDANAVLLDVREDHEWEQGHIKGAVHLAKGILERDLEKRVPDTGTEILMYCGGGYRSVLAAEAAQKLGYKNVASVKEGYKGMARREWPIESGAQQS